jgi:CheY-like chemotaxis protein
MDLAMPVLDGWEAIRRLLTKPFGPEALELAIRVVLKRREEQ